MSTTIEPLATPQFPGHYINTPSSDSPSTRATESPLDRAGKDLLLPSSVASSGSATGTTFLGAAAGLLAAGVPGAVFGAGLGGIASLEHDGLRDRLARERNKTQDVLAPPPDTTIQTTPTSKDVSSLPSQNEQSSSTSHLAIGAGAGAAALGAGGAIALAEHESKTAPLSQSDSAVPVPVTSTNTTTPSPQVNTTEPSSLSTPSSRAGTGAPIPVTSNPIQVSPTSPTSSSDREVAPESPASSFASEDEDDAKVLGKGEEKRDEGLTGGEKAAIVAGGAGLGVAGGAALAEHEKTKELSSSSGLPSSPPPTSATTTTTTTTREGPIQPKGKESTFVPSQSVEEKKDSVWKEGKVGPDRGVRTVGEEEKEKVESEGLTNADVGSGVATGAAAGVAAAEVAKTETADLSPRPTTLTSRFSDSTFASSIDSSDLSHLGGSPITFEDQRAILPTLGDEPTSPTTKKLNPSDLVVPTSLAGLVGFAAVPKDFREEELTAAQRDFAHLSPPTSHDATIETDGTSLVESETTPVLGSRATFAAGGEDSANDKEVEGHEKEMAALGVVGLGVVGGGAAYLAHRGEGIAGDSSPPRETGTTSLPHSPKTRDLSRAAAGGDIDDQQVGEHDKENHVALPFAAAGGAAAGGTVLSHELLKKRLAAEDDVFSPTAPSGPSSTRAVKGSPPSGTPFTAMTPSTTPGTPTSLRAASPIVPPSREFDNSPTTPSSPSSPTPGAAPVVLSPHMKIATRKDSIGRNRLHKTSHDVLRQAPPAAGGGAVERQGSVKLRKSQVVANGENEHIGDGGEGSGGATPPTAGEEIWKSSVAHVVNDETEIRGQRPALVTIESEDRRDGVQSGRQSTTPPQVSTTTPNRARSRSSASQTESPSSPNSSGHKLIKRRASLSQRRSVDEKKEGGFINKLFGGGSHSRKSSVDAEGVGRRGSLDSQGRQSFERT